MTRSKWCWLAVAVAGMLLPAVALGAASVDTKGAVTVNADDNVGDAGAFAAATASIIEEADPADITVGNIVITAPAGFEFDTTAEVTVTPNPGDLNLGAGDGIALVVTPEEDTITVPVTEVSTAATTLTFTGITLRALDCEAADATATPDVTVTAPGGDLTDAALIDVTITAGELAGLMFNAAIANQVACTNFNVAVRSVDACENPVNVAADTAVAFAVATGTGELTAAAGARAITAEQAMVLVRPRGRAMAKAADDPGFWQNDAVSLLLETERHSYYEIAVNPAGAVWDADWSAGGEPRMGPSVPARHGGADTGAAAHPVMQDQSSVTLLCSHRFPIVEAES